MYISLPKIKKIKKVIFSLICRKTVQTNFYTSFTMDGLATHNMLLTKLSNILLIHNLPPIVKQMYHIRTQEFKYFTADST